MPVDTVVTEIAETSNGSEVSTADAVRCLDFDVVVIGEGMDSTSVTWCSPIQPSMPNREVGSPPADASRDLREKVWRVSSFVDDVSETAPTRSQAHRHLWLDAPKAPDRRANTMPHAGVMNLRRFHRSCVAIETAPGVDFADPAVKLGWYD
jgi:hypothetical protein